MSAAPQEPGLTGNAGQLGYADAIRTVTAMYAGGVNIDVLAAHHHDVAARLLNDAQTAAGRAYAREYSDTGSSLIGDLRSDAEAAARAPEPGGTPHPDPRLAARGWQRCADDCGVYVRRESAAQMDREAV